MSFWQGWKRPFRQRPVLTVLLAILLGGDLTTDIIADEMHDKNEIVAAWRGVSQARRYSSEERNRSVGLGVKTLCVAAALALVSVVGGQKQGPSVDTDGGIGVAQVQFERNISIPVSRAEEWTRIPEIADAMQAHSAELGALALQEAPRHVRMAVEHVFLKVTGAPGKLFAEPRVVMSPGYNLDSDIWASLRIAIQDLLREKIGSVVAELTGETRVDSVVKSVIDRQLEEMGNVVRGRK